MKCETVRDEIKAYVDGELGMFARRKVERHLATCAACRMEEGLMRAVTDRVRSAETATAPAGLRERVLGGIEFAPADGGPRKLRWMPAAAALVVAGLLFAIVMPITRTARESSRESSRRADEPSTGAVEMPASRPPMKHGSYDYLAKQARPRAVQRKVERDDTTYQVYVAGPAPAATKSATPRPGLQIIKTADLTVRVKQFQDAYDEAVRIASSVGGYVTNSSAATEGTTPTSGTLTIRVPAVAFDRTVERLGKLGVVKSRAVNGQDVTGDVVDLESRLRNKRAEERQYLDIMNRAKRVPDIVTVTEELSRVRGEIEEMQGQLSYLRKSAAMSTINLQLSESDKPSPKPQSGLSGTFGSAVGSLGSTLSALAAMLIWLAVYSPFWALPLAAWWFYVARKRMTSPVSE